MILSEVPRPIQLPSGWKATVLTNLGGEREREREREREERESLISPPPSLPPLSLSLSPAMFMKGVDIFLGLSVPQSDSLIISPGHYQSAIGRETGTTYPVTVTTEAELELLTVDSPHLEGGGERGRGGERGGKGRRGGGTGKEGQPSNSLNPPSLFPSCFHTLTVLSSEAVRRE